MRLCLSMEGFGCEELEVFTGYNKFLANSSQIRLRGLRSFILTNHQEGSLRNESSDPQQVCL